MESNPPPPGGGPPGNGGGSNNPPKKDGAPPAMNLPAASAATAAFLKPAVPMQQVAQKPSSAAMPSSGVGVPTTTGGAASGGDAAMSMKNPQGGLGTKPMWNAPPSAFGGMPTAPTGASGGVGAIKKPAAKKPTIGGGVPASGLFGAGAPPSNAMINNGSNNKAAPTIPPPARQLPTAPSAASAASAPQKWPKQVNPMVKTAAMAAGSSSGSTSSSAPPKKMEAKKQPPMGAGNVVNPNPFIPGKSLPLTAKQKSDASTSFKTIMPPPANAGKPIAPMMPMQTSASTTAVGAAKDAASAAAQQRKDDMKKKQMLMDQVTHTAVANANAAAMAAAAGKKKKAPAKKKTAASAKASPQQQQSSFPNMGMKQGLAQPMKQGPSGPGGMANKPFVPFHPMPPAAGSTPGGGGPGKGPPPPPGTNGGGMGHMAKMSNPMDGGRKPPPPVAASSSASVASAASAGSNSNIINRPPSTASAHSASGPSPGASSNNGNGGDAANMPLHSTGRELKVEDALLYLDQVKLEFGDRPRIYNEFLEIMKNFKAQEVDTIGVINRVRRLFHGYNNLILGFNTFLPEGYKIEMRDLEPVFVGPGLTGTTHTPGFKPPPGPGGPPGRGMPGRGHPPGGRGMGPPAFGRGGRGMPPPGRGPMMGRGPPPPPGAAGGRGGPMPGRGGPPQLGGPGRGGSMAPAPGRGGPMMAGRGPPPPPAQGGPGGMKPTPAQQQMMQQAQNAKAKQAQMQQQQQQNQHQQQQQQAQSSQQQQQQQQQGAAATRTIEFDHAIMYVTNIKKRFANQPRIYHTFLEILHTYQKEQRGIKEVLEQVSSLFADHPDLLREFTFFLPDAVQEQAKERLSRAAAEAEAKQRAAAVEAAAKQQQQQVQAQQQAQVAQQQQAAAAASAAEASAKSGSKSAPTGWRTSGVGGPKPKAGTMGARAGVEPLLPSGTQKFIDMTQPEEAGLESPSRRGQAPIAAAPVQPTSSAQPQPPAQETFVYNAGVERQFFDLVKAALTSFSRDGQAYAEFIKTLDMYAQEILSRNDMLGYVERLLGKHKDLFEEFKRIINAVGSPDAPAHDDSWHSVPLSEIDFSRCRRCSPSYRALPRDYPNPPCSERSPEEVKVLNDVWVSLPMGSEENNTFRHMRKNQYEETLFRCEDMRFEIDMCIDSNAATLQRLTKINDEIQFLSENELLFTKGGSIVKKSICPDGAGLGGKIYQYTLDGRVLGVIHKHAINRIYGDDGNEMLDLCYKNPAVALPIVVNRLRQKDEEWRAARDVLNRKWKDLAEHNYYKSLDHRSITWRTTDKRATSTRTIVAEIKDRAAHNGLEGEAAANARMEKMKEEHGTFYEITMGCSIPRKMDLTGLPLPTRTIFTPHMSFLYDNNSWAQRDAYRIISFALERGSVSPGDKERCFRLWRDFIGPWFGLSLGWMQSPAALFTASPEALEDQGEDEGDSTSTGNNNDEEKEINRNVAEMEDAASKSSSSGENDDTNNITASQAIDGDVVKEETMKPETAAMNGAAEVEDTGYFSSTNHIPFPPETLVSTSFGEGKVIQYLQDDGVYEVSYPASQSELLNDDDASRATAYLRPTAVYGSLFPVEPSLLTEQLRTNDPEVPERPDDQLIIGTQCLYLFFRLHQVLIRRLGVAKKLAVDVSNDTALGRHIEKLTYENDPDEGKKRYDAFLGLVYALIDSGIGASEPSEGGKYEDRVRHLLGNNAYELTTMDKLISHILKHLQNMANDDTLQNMIEIYRRHELAGNFKPSAFREEAALMSEGENMFAFQICNMPKTDQKISHCEFLGCIAEDVEDEDESGAMENNDDHKRGIDEIATDDADDSAQAAKRPKRAA